MGPRVPSGGPPTFFVKKVGKKAFCETAFRLSPVLHRLHVVTASPRLEMGCVSLGFCDRCPFVRLRRGGAMSLSARSEREVPPCGAGSFLFAQKGTKNALGAASGERLRGAGAHSHCPQTPIYGGRRLVSSAFASGGQNLHGWFFLFRGYCPLAGLKFTAPALYAHRLPWHSQGSWALGGGAVDDTFP